MSHEKINSYQAWFESSLKLDEIGDRLKKCGLIEEFDYDSENVYEWIEGPTTKQKLKLNISRKHCDGRGYEKEPIHILVINTANEPEADFVYSIAQGISTELKSAVSVGTINYVGGDDFEYNPIDKFN